MTEGEKRGATKKFFKEFLSWPDWQPKTASEREARMTALDKLILDKFPDKSLSYSDVKMSKLDYAALMLVPAVLFLYGVYRFNFDPPRPMQPADVFLSMYLPFCFVYILITWIMLREIRLRGFLRYLFCLTIVPLYPALFIFALAVVSGRIPGFFESNGGGGANKGQAILLVILVALVCWAWHRLLLFIDRKIYPTSTPE